VTASCCTFCISITLQFVVAKNSNILAFWCFLTPSAVLSCCCRKPGHAISESDWSVWRPAAMCSQPAELPKSNAACLWLGQPVRTCILQCSKETWLAYL
jgi:hypothetical protein